MFRNILLIVGFLIVIGGAAFIYFDPLDMDILGLKPASPVVTSKAPPHVAARAAKPPVVQPQIAVAPVPVSAPAAAPSQASAPVAVTAQVSAPAAAPTQAAKPVAPTPMATPRVVTPPVEKPGLVSPPPSIFVKNIKAGNKLSKHGKLPADKPAINQSVINKPDRPKNLDLRHCLELESPQAIAICAGE